MSIETWLAFLVACWIISLSPGAGAVASMASGMNYGFARGYWNALGLQLALLLQIAVVAAGVGALLATSALAFALIKWFGVGYLLYLAFRQWRAPTREMSLEPRPIGRPLSLVLRGFVINISNPKAIVFILAVLPQFIDPGRPLLMQYLLMALTMVTVDLVVMAGYTGLAAKAMRLLDSPRQQRLLNRSFAVMYGIASGLLATVRRV
ncbi:LysE family transporter [Pseudomonas sp. MYb185]|uniref:LysE family transporter n=1 Tax=Pseudomonas sp. MYb185 TaxID=1848729 RepID=UPI000CFBBCEE|nr:LysE family transporter [Pseudomonas sp. MYb185]PRB82104.1 threonine transporter RhtB [Pseudomonas sp. MYb185]